MPATSDVGSCAVCGLVFHVIPSTGVLRRHGHGGMCPPCAGSGVLPAGSADVPSDFRELLNTAIGGSLRSEDSSDSDDMPTPPATEAF